MLHDHPSASQILAAVRRFLHEEVAAVAESDVAFRAKVAGRLIGVVERELAQGAEAEDRYRALLGGLGVRDEAELAEEIRAGRLGLLDDHLMAALDTMTRDRLAVSNPDYLADVPDDDPRAATVPTGDASGQPPRGRDHDPAEEK